jgi:putative oxidoreductase
MKKIQFALAYTRHQLARLTGLPLLLMRLILAYGFYEPAISKMNDIEAIASWFSDMGLPFPTLNAYLATYTEFFGFILLLIGLGTRWISIPLIITLIVAIKTVHWENGFSSGNNGYEIPLYYIIMLVTLLVYGSGKISSDYVITSLMSRYKNNETITP